MTKRISILLIAFIYSFSVVGVTVSQHFCGGEPTAKSCGCAKSAKKKACCEDKTIHAKVKQDQKASVFQFDFVKIGIPVLVNNYNSFLFQFQPNSLCQISTQIAKAPLQRQILGLYLYNCVFRI